MIELVNLIRLNYGEEQAMLVYTVSSVVRSKIQAKNLFGWREFIDDVIAGVVMHMIKTDFKYSGGAYVACGMQGAIDSCRYCSAQKRRGNYETISLDEVENFVSPTQEPSYAEEMNELVLNIEEMYGPEIAEHIKAYLEGRISKISKEVLAKCQTEEFRELLLSNR